MTIARDDGLTPVSSLGNCPETAIREATVGYRADCRLLGSNPDWDMRIGTDTSALLRSASGLPVSVEIVYIALAAPAESGVKERLGWRLD